MNIEHKNYDIEYIWELKYLCPRNNGFHIGCIHELQKFIQLHIEDNFSKNIVDKLPNREQLQELAQNQDYIMCNHQHYYIFYSH